MTTIIGLSFMYFSEFEKVSNTGSNHWTWYARDHYRLFDVLLQRSSPAWVPLHSGRIAPEFPTNSK